MPDLYAKDLPTAWMAAIGRLLRKLKTGKTDPKRTYRSSVGTSGKSQYRTSQTSLSKDISLLIRLLFEYAFITQPAQIDRLKAPLSVSPLLPLQDVSFRK